MTKTFNLQKLIRFNTSVSSASWDPGLKLWKITTNSGAEMTANFLIRCTSHLEYANPSKILGEETFRGDVVHSRHWRPAISVEGRHVAVIGTGASGVQIVPTIADQVASLTVFQRTPAFVPNKINFAIPYAIQVWPL